MNDEQAVARPRLLAMINAGWMAQAISSAVQLGVPAQLAAGARSAEALAAAIGCHAPSLLRLLRALTTLDMLREEPGQRFALTATGGLLLADADGSVAAWATLAGTRLWQLWGQLAACVQSGQSARQRTWGVDDFGQLQADRAAADVFNRAMVELTRPVAAALVREVDLSGCRRVVDVGGGVGELVATVLARHPSMLGVLYDLPHAIDAAQAHLRTAGVADRCSLVAGDFFAAVPPGADAYLLKSVLHDWDDERSLLILRRCAEAMPGHARLLLIERIAPDALSTTPRDQGLVFSDLNMLVATGGRERTEAQFLELLAAAGLRRMRRLRLTEVCDLLECTKTA